MAQRNKLLAMTTLKVSLSTLCLYSPLVAKGFPLEVTAKYLALNRQCWPAYVGTLL